MNTNTSLKPFTERFATERVFGEPHESDGVTVIPAARVLAGGGSGSRDGRETGASESGGGMGLVAYPVGAYVIKDGAVSWRPAWDVNRLVIGAQAILIGAALLRLVARRRR